MKDFCSSKVVDGSEVCETELEASFERNSSDFLIRMRP